MRPRDQSPTVTPAQFAQLHRGSQPGVAANPPEDVAVAVTVPVTLCVAVVVDVSVIEGVCELVPVPELVAVSAGNVDGGHKWKHVCDHKVLPQQQLVTEDSLA